MLAFFTIAVLAILVIGPLENEGGSMAIQDKGEKQAIHDAFERGDISEIKGNYGNK